LDTDTDTCKKLGHALKHNTTLKSFKCELVWGDRDKTESIESLLHALKHNCTLESFGITLPWNCDGRRVGAACADALAGNSTLKSFVCDVLYGSRITFDNDDIALSFANALKRNTALKSFALFAPQGVQPSRARVILDALKYNGVLEQLQLGIQDDEDEGLKAAVVDALRENVNLQSFYSEPFRSERQSLEELAAPFIERNVELRRQGHALACLAKLSDASAFKSLTEKVFRARVFAFFLPPGCKWMPLELSTTMAFNPIPTEEPLARSDVVRGSTSLSLDAASTCVQELHTSPRKMAEVLPDEVLEESAQHAQQQHQAAVAEAIFRSKLDAPKEIGHGHGEICLLRLTQSSAEVNKVIMESEALAPCRLRVSEAGCEVMPGWANGATFL